MSASVSTAAAFTFKGLSVGALMGSIGYGFGLMLSQCIGHGWSFAGIVSLSTGFSAWAGFCGFGIGFALAIRQSLHNKIRNETNKSV